MKQFEIYKNPNPSASRRRPYLVVLQSDLLSVVETVVVAPLATLERTKPISRLTPIVDLDGLKHALMVHELAAIPRGILKRCVGSAASKRDEILSALDLVFLGF